MIDTRIDQILKLVRVGSILSESAFASVNLSAAMDLRQVDQCRFLYTNELHARWRIQPIHPDMRQMHEELWQMVQEIVRLRIMAVGTGMTGRDDDALRNILPDMIAQELTDIVKSRATEYSQG